jgi:hypothetical protein
LAEQRIGSPLSACDVEKDASYGWQNRYFLRIHHGKHRFNVYLIYGGAPDCYA